MNRLLAVLAMAIGCATATGAEPTNQIAKANPGEVDPETSTHWNPSPEWVKDASGGYRSIGLKSFEGAEEPLMKFVVADGKAVRDSFVNISDMGGGVVRMFLR